MRRRGCLACWTVPRFRTRRMPAYSFHLWRSDFVLHIIYHYLKMTWWCCNVHHIRLSTLTSCVACDADNAFRHNGMPKSLHQNDGRACLDHERRQPMSTLQFGPRQQSESQKPIVAWVSSSAASKFRKANVPKLVDNSEQEVLVPIKSRYGGYHDLSDTKDSPIEPPIGHVSHAGSAQQGQQHQMTVFDSSAFWKPFSERHFASRSLPTSLRSLGADPHSIDDDVQDSNESSLSRVELSPCHHDKWIAPNHRFYNGTYRLGAVAPKR